MRKQTGQPECSFTWYCKMSGRYCPRYVTFDTISIAVPFGLGQETSFGFSIYLCQPAIYHIDHAVLHFTNMVIPYRLQYTIHLYNDLVWCLDAGQP